MVGLVAATAAVLALGAAVHLTRSASADDFVGARLTFPVSYVNANGAVFLSGFWSAVSLAAHRSLAVPLRVLSSGAATAAAGRLADDAEQGRRHRARRLGGRRARARAGAAPPARAGARPGAPGRGGVPAADGAVSHADGRRAGRRRARGGAGDARRRPRSRSRSALVYVLADRRVSLSQRAHRGAVGLAAAGLAAVALAAVVSSPFAASDSSRQVGQRSSHSRRRRAAAATSSTWARTATTSGASSSRASASIRSRASAPAASSPSTGGNGGASRSPRAATRSRSTPCSRPAIVGFVLLVIALGAILVGLARRAATVRRRGGARHLHVLRSCTPPATGSGRSRRSACSSSCSPAQHFGRGAGAAAPRGGARRRRCGPARRAGRRPVVPRRPDHDRRARARNDPSALDTARTLDPLAVEPWLAEHALARTTRGTDRGAARRPRARPQLAVAARPARRDADRGGPARGSPRGVRRGPAPRPARPSEPLLALAP